MSRRSQALMGGFHSGAAALSPASSGEQERQDPIPKTEWTRRVRANFASWDKDGDGFISMSEANGLLQDPTIQGNDAAALAALHGYIEHIEELSNDELGDENDGVTLNDLTAFERGVSEDSLDNEDRADWGYSAGQGKVGRGQLNRSAYGATRKGQTYNELFINGVPSLSSLRQGGIGDCYFLAALAGVINRDPGELVRMIERNVADGKVTSYTVSFPQRSLGAVTVPAPTDAEIARYSSAGRDGLWLIVMEKAYAQARGGDNVQEEIGEGGQLSTGVKAMSGNKTDTDILTFTRESTTKRKLQGAFKDGKLVTAAIMSKNRLKLPSGHAYTVLGFDGSALTIRNPWGSLPSEVPKDVDGFKPDAGGVFKISLTLFDDVFSQITYEK